MRRHFKPDPYNGFKDDRERRRALNVRACCMALAAASLNPKPIQQRAIFLAELARLDPITKRPDLVDAGATHGQPILVPHQPGPFALVLACYNFGGGGSMVELFDVEGIPVSLGNVPGVEISCAAWDRVPPRVFDPVSARRNGAPVSMNEFLALLSPEALAFMQSARNSDLQPLA